METKTVVITYSAPVNLDPTKVAEICATFQPTSAAADLDVFDGTYYDTNVPGFGVGDSLDAWMAQQVAHPGLIAAMRKAVRDGEYQFETEDEELCLYIEECAPALADQGFQFVINAI